MTARSERTERTLSDEPSANVRQERRYTRTAFTPSDQSYGDVRLIDPIDLVTVLRVIPAKQLQARAMRVDHAPLVKRSERLIPDAPRPKRATRPGVRDWI